MKKSLLLMLLMAFLLPWALNAQTTLTVNDGTNANNYVPIYGLYADEGVKCEYVIPAALLEDMNGGTISAMKLYLQKASYGAGTITPSFTIFMKEVDATTMTAFTGSTDATTVYNNTISITTSTTEDKEVEITFEDGYVYGGGNLLIGFYQNGTSSYKSTAWYGESQTYNSAWSGYGSSSNASGSAKGFLPKTTFTYTPGAAPTCEKPATLEADPVTATSATLTWSGGSGTYNVEVKGGSYADWTAVLEGTSLTTTILTLQPTTSYQARVQSVCGGETSGYKTASFTTPCAAYDIPYSYGFEDAAPFACWTPIAGAAIDNTSSNVHSGSKYLKFSGTTSNMIAFPAINADLTNLRLEFWTRPESNTNSSCGKFAVGYMTDLTDASSFVALANYNYNDWSSATYVKKIVDYNADGVPTDAYIAMRQYDNSTAWYWFVDDITVKEIPSCLEPAGLAVSSDADAIGPNSIKLQFTAGESNESAWKLQYKKSADSEWTTITDAITENPYELPGLLASTQYDIRIAAWCDPSNPDGISGYTEPIQVATACEVVNLSLSNYIMNFDDYSGISDYTPASRVLPICWSFINECAYSSYKFYPTISSYYSTSYGHSGSNYLRLYSSYSSSYDYNPQPQYAILPEMNGLDGKQITLWARGYNAASSFKIGWMSDPTDVSTFNLINEQTFTSSNYSTYQELTYEIPATISGNYIAIMIDAASSSRTSNGVYIDDIVVEPVPSCKKPSALMLETPSSRTAHTATLKWTNGEEGQDAWQIAVDTIAAFNPDTVPAAKLIPADNDTFIVDGLLANKQYYAYVRANCGNNDFSAWSTAKASFKTLVGNAAPTNLAVIASTITSSEAMVSWKGVKTNDLHQSFDLYYSELNTMPSALDPDNLIENITDTFYLFQKLAHETTYYVWVRDNCGTDGLSAWSSRASFTTAASCQTPDGLAAADITASSASISWNTYGQTGFNLRYGTDGENWTLESGVSSPYPLSGLTGNTAYKVQVQVQCNTGVWSSEMSFRTDCNAIGTLPWSENFDKYTGSTSTSAPTSYPNDELPECWHFLNRSETNSTYPQVFISSNSGYPVSGKCLFFKSSSTTPLYAVLPAFTENISSLQLKFTYRNEGTGSSNGTLIVGYMTDPADATSFTAVLTCEQTTTLTEKEVLFPGAPAGSIIAFKYQGGSSNNYYMSIDNVSVDIAPSCLKPSNLAVEANAQSADLSWVSEVGAYSVAHALEATAEPNDNIVAASVSDESYEMNNLALGDHYFWVRANCGGSNGSSDWVGPVSVHIGYCVPAPTSVDGSGISNVTFGNGAVLVNNDTHPTSNPFYGDYTAQIGAVQAGVEASIAITYATGYTYNTYVWVDLNNNLSFEPEEVVTSGESTDANPTTLTLNFTIPATQATGNYRMRIGGADSGLGSTPANANPCYTGTYGIFEDYTLRVLEAPSCFPPTALSAEVNGFGATITWASDADKFNLQYKKTAEAETAWVAVGNIEATSYAIGNLDGGTEYEVQIQANCGSSNSEWSSSVTFTTALCAAEDQCVLTFELTDSYGDSWNGNAIRVTDVLSGKVLGEMANENLNGTTGSGENEVNIKTLSVCNGREIQFSWVTGSYPNETSYVVKDVNGQVIFSGSGAMSEAINYTVDCTHKFYLEIGTSGYATFYDEDYAYTMPANLSGHTFNAATGLSDAIYEANQIIPAKEPLVMKAADDVVLPETFVLVEAETDALPSAGNDLIGVNAETYIADAADSLFYVLSLPASNNTDSVGFYWMKPYGAGGFIMPAHKAYLKLLKPTDPTSAPAAFYLFNGENNATWLNSLEGVEGTVKFMHEGNIYILRDSIIYDATGRKVRELK